MNAVATDTNAPTAPFASKYEDAISDRLIYTPDRDGLEYSPDKLNWSNKDYQLPTGDKLGVFKVANTALYRVGFVSKTANGRLIPEPYDGLYTKPDIAQRDLETYLRGAWDDSERRTANANRKEERAKHEEKVSDSASSAGV